MARHHGIWLLRCGALRALALWVRPARAWRLGQSPAKPGCGAIGPCGRGNPVAPAPCRARPWRTCAGASPSAGRLRRWGSANGIAALLRCACITNPDSAGDWVVVARPASLGCAEGGRQRSYGQVHAASLQREQSVLLGPRQLGRRGRKSAQPAGSGGILAHRSPNLVRRGLMPAVRAAVASVWLGCAP